MSKIVFGPVPSRRLGHSLGINNIKPKTCSNSCIYCQIGKTSNLKAERESFYKPENIFKEVQSKVREINKTGEAIDYLTFVPQGEPTLDINIGKEIEILKSLDIKVAVISNASLFWDENIQHDLLKADLVSVKIDAVSTNVWHQINRPHGSLRIDNILEGISRFSNIYDGKLITETMLVRNINDNLRDLEGIANFIANKRIGKSYISIPIRPPSEKCVEPPTEEVINMAYQIFSNKGINVEYIIGYEGNDFSTTGNIEEDILGITSVHPMREEGVNEFLKRAGANWTVIEKLVNKDRLIEVEYKNKKFYLRKLMN